MTIRRLNKIMLVGICTFFLNCRSNQKSAAVEFYTEHGGMDYARIPFINPYEALILNGFKMWRMNLMGHAIDLSVTNIKTANVINRTIILYSTNTLLNGADTKEAWFVIVPDKHIEKGFYNYQDFVRYLLQLGFNGDPKLYKMEDIAKYYEKHETMNWKDIR